MIENEKLNDVAAQLRSDLFDLVYEFGELRGKTLSPVCGYTEELTDAYLQLDRAATELAKAYEVIQSLDLFRDAERDPSQRSFSIPLSN